MPISRRQFFRGFLDPIEKIESDRRKRLAAIEGYLRANLMPYDFTLSKEQCDLLFAEIRMSISGFDEENMYSPRVRQVMDGINETTIQRWREEHWQADKVRQAAFEFVKDFLDSEATPEDVRRLRDRFNVPYPASVGEELQRQAENWINSLSDTRILEFDTSSVRELVFSELRSWC